MQEEHEDFSIDKDSDLDDSVVAEEHAGDALKKLKEKLKEAEAKAKEHLDGWQRAQADFVNLRKRDEEAKGEFLKFANAATVEQLLPVLDSFQMAIAHGEKGSEPIYNQLLGILRQNGLEELNPMGEQFDPRMHEAVGSIATSDAGEDHKILEVVQKGYILSGKIIRPAKVRIGDYKANQ